MSLAIKQESFDKEQNYKEYSSRFDGDYEEKMLQGNFGLVMAEIKQTYIPEHLYECAISEGRIGLLKAIRNFDPEKGAFSTYAVMHIKDAVKRFVAKNKPAVNISIHKIKEDASIRKNSDKSSTVVSLASACAANIDDPETISQIDSSRFDDFMSFDYERDLRKGLSALREELVVTMVYRYGLLGQEVKSQAEIGSMLGVSRNKVRELEQEGLVKLRKLLVPAL